MKTLWIFLVALQDRDGDFLLVERTFMWVHDLYFHKVYFT